MGSDIPAMPQMVVSLDIDWIIKIKVILILLEAGFFTSVFSPDVKGNSTRH